MKLGQVLRKTKTSKTMNGNLFYSKILLFGEYGLLEDSKGLSVPYNCYNGVLKKVESDTPEAKKSNSSLKKFIAYLDFLQQDKPDLVTFNIDTLKADVSAGMYFDSSIPQGYGVGSSGALVAAIYGQYAINKISVEENLTLDKLLFLKNIFSQMEAFFHGKSSGLDPLNSYLSLPILIHSKNNIEATGLPSQSLDGKSAVFLLDSGVAGETAPMITIFMENLKNKGFRSMLKNQFIKHTNACVENFLKGDIPSLLVNTKKLSKVVLNHFKPMIPQEFHEIWQKGIETNSYYLKLCGSGGGGYILGFTKDLDKAKETLQDYKIEIVYQF